MNKKSVGFTQSIRHSLPGNNNERENKLDYFSRSRCRSNRFNKKINLIFFFKKFKIQKNLRVSRTSRSFLWHSKRMTIKVCRPSKKFKRNLRTARSNLHKCTCSSTRKFTTKKKLKMQNNRRARQWHVHVNGYRRTTLKTNRELCKTHRSSPTKVGGLAASRDLRISTLKKKNKSSEEKQKERNNNLVNRMSRNQ